MMPVFSSPTKEEPTAAITIGELMADDDDEVAGGGDTGWMPLIHGEKAVEAKKWVDQRRQGMRSWREFSIPRSPMIAGQRIVRNVEYFQTNYAVVFLVLAAYCVLTSPVLLFALAASGGLAYLVRSNEHKLVVAGKPLPVTYQYGVIAVLSFPLFWMAGAGSTIFWVIGASIFFIVLHALAFASEPVPGKEFEQEIETV